MGWPFRVVPKWGMGDRLTDTFRSQALVLGHILKGDITLDEIVLYCWGPFLVRRAASSHQLIPMSLGSVYQPWKGDLGRLLSMHIILSMLQPCTTKSFNPDCFPCLLKDSLFFPMSYREIKPLPVVKWTSDDRHSRIRQVSWAGHYEYQGNSGVTVFRWRIWAKYRKSLEELQHLESKSLMKLIVRATMEGLWYNFSDTCKRASACF